MGAYLQIFFPDVEIIPISIGIAFILGLVNLLGSKKSGTFQIVLLVFLISILVVFIIGGISEVKTENFSGIFDTEFTSLFSTAGFVFMSYIGITKVISLAEEISRPEINLVRGIFWALGTSLIIYVLGLIIMVGVIPMDTLAGSLIPAAVAAEAFSGRTGVILISFAAIFSFLSVANAGILSASRYPLAMSRDHLIPTIFRKIDSKGTPFVSIIISVLIIAAIIYFLNPTTIAKLTSTFLLLLFSITCFSVIIMRESKIESYDPSFKSPFYPWMQIFGIVSSFIFIMEMGWMPFLFSVTLIIAGSLWYFYYAKGHVLRTGAIYNIFERLGQYKYAGIDYELRDLMKKRTPKKEDPFDEIVAKSFIIDIDEISNFEEIAKQVAEWISEDINYPAKKILKEFLDGTRIGATPVIRQIALPHLIIDGLENPKLALVRPKKGVKILYKNPLSQSDEITEVIVKAVFFLVSPKKNPTQHLRILARIASRVEENSFFKDWDRAKNPHELKIAMLHYERFLYLKISNRDETINMSENSLQQINLPKGSLVAWIRRNNDNIIPDGSTILKENDILTIIGEPDSLDEIVKKYHLIRTNYFE
ncbi:MAG: amino acid permease [Melioribacteraceae bacterium]|nr:amino acid permease [Melioribacteraceae bacterium]